MKAVALIFAHPINSRSLYGISGD
jgi:hypothetical protein